MTVSPALGRPNPSKLELFDQFGQAVHILVDNGMPLSRTALLEHKREGVENNGNAGRRKARAVLKENEIADETDGKTREEDDER